MKKFLCLILAAAALLPACVWADAGFTDLDSSHWSYGYVSRLVEDKTVNGYEDGSFNPDGLVTRAEFVKMIGKSSERAASDFRDVPSSHWAYEYIMQSGMSIAPGEAFRPDDVMTRNDVASLVWKRAGGKAGIKSAPNTTEGFTEKDAAAWVYTYGIMNGNDGVYLRPDDGITRAEAAAIICRSRDITENSPTVNFRDKVSGGILETVFNSSKLFNDKYSPEKTLTNGQLAKAGIRFITNEPDPSYSAFILAPGFEDEYARDTYVMAHYVLGDEYSTKEFCNAEATVEDAAAFLAYCAVLKSTVPLGYGAKDNYYPEISGEEMTETKNQALTLAYNLGITFDADGKIGAKNKLTHKDAALLLLQLDSVAGIYNYRYISADAKTTAKTHINIDTVSYPKNKDSYQAILADMPSYVYEAPFVNGTARPITKADYTMNYSGIFADFVRNVCTAARVRTKTEAIVYFSPTMIYKTKDGYALRVKIAVTKAASGAKLSDFVPLGANAQDIEIKNGDIIYCDLNTGCEITDINVPATRAYISQIIKGV